MPKEIEFTNREFMTIHNFPVFIQGKEGGPIVQIETKAMLEKFDNDRWCIVKNPDNEADRRARLAGNAAVLHAEEIRKGSTSPLTGLMRTKQGETYEGYSVSKSVKTSTVALE